MQVRFAPFVLSAAFCAASFGVASAQEAPVTTTNADGDYVVASDDGDTNVSGEGEGVVYGDVNTGGGGGEVLGDPAALSNVTEAAVPSRESGDWVFPVTDSDLVPDLEDRPRQAPAPAPESTTTADGTTTTDIQSEDGTASEAGAAPAGSTAAEPVDDGSGVPVDGSAPAAAPAAPASSGTTCGSFATWYDAQVTYEAEGGTAADPALVEALDPDYDGIVCEDSMM